MLALLRTRRWLGYLALVVLFATVCVALGTWQWHRREEALAAIARLDANYDEPAVPLEDVLEEPDDYEIDQQWTVVEVTGEYLVDEQLLLRGRVRDTAVGFDVVVPFRTDAGAILLVDRGWVPPGSTSAAPDAVPAPPEGEVTIVARLREDEGAIAGRGAPEGQIASVDLDAIAETHDEPVYTGAYGLLVTEDGQVADGVAPFARPVLDEGPHLSYTLQWFVFAIMGFVGFGWALRREARGDAELDEQPREPRGRRRQSDADVEDAILDGVER
ncbi:SURF1 family cytochrome oxidase biogenesis protein [Agrococcus sp. SGAir0287]|uniref:SURF1 family cytochrome oxidase biogenesis protein n=1 Tax=Agrococcus sp. SGAir0287 TaxID=2070347 RepID=UPI0010CD3D24|nr:SURF1 family protein [Agrococcus sp. SGAir0287]QCR19239.1 SURF1 family protein [Agrococcus sp. SGAir0287]